MGEILLLSILLDGFYGFINLGTLDVSINLSNAGNFTTLKFGQSDQEFQKSGFTVLKLLGDVVQSTRLIVLCDRNVFHKSHGFGNAFISLSWLSAATRLGSYFEPPHVRIPF